MTDIWRRSGVRYPDKCPIPPVDTAVTALESAEVCKNQNSGGITYLKYEKINRTTKALSLNMTLTSPIDSNVGLKIDAEKWSSSGWTKIPYLPVIPNACSTLKRFYSTYMTDIWRRSGVKYPDKCPIPPTNSAQRGSTHSPVMWWDYG
nr:unnamed protein product [Callosobruchus analis]